MSDEDNITSKTPAEAWAKKIDGLKTKHIVIAVCLVASAVIALMGKEGWGWFLFAALMLT